MSDSDDDILQNVFAFQTENTTVWAKGPNITTNLTGSSFRNNILSSTMQMPTNFVKPRFTEPDFDQRSAHSRREISPMSYSDRRSNYNRWETSSMYGGGDAKPRNFNSRDPMRTMSSRRFAVNGRRRSPFSVRSTGPRFRNNILTSTMQMPTNFERPRFTEPDFDQRSTHSRRAISPMSNIDHRSNYNRWETSSMYGGGDARAWNFNSRDSVHTMSSRRSVVNGRSGSPFSVRSTASTSESARSIAMAFKNIKFDKDDLRLIKDAFSMYIDNKAPVNKLHNVPPQKQRFENGYLLPSHRFNKSTAVLPILEANEYPQNNTEAKRKEMSTTERLVRNCRHKNDEQDEIFSENSDSEKTMYGHEPERKRNLNNEDNLYLPDKKRHKLSSPIKTNDRIKKALPKQTNNNSNNKENGESNHFEFVKPALLKKSTIKTKDKLISKSAQPILDTVQCVQNIAQGQTSQPMNENLEKLIDEPSQVNSMSDISMRPSFIKRKLFTQKLDVTEKHNISGVNSSMNSPQANIYSAIQNEKHKARKLVTSQLCLSRDVREGSNLLDLIHRIVPPEQMSVTNQMNKTVLTHNKNKSVDYDDKWDVTSIITTCNDDNISDTYTDEEIFTDKKKINNMPNQQQEPSSKINTTVVRNTNIGKLPDVQTLNKPEKIQRFEAENVSNKHTQNYVKSFWDIDSESEVECTTPLKNLSLVKEDQRTCQMSYKEMTKNQAKNKPEPRNNITINNNVPAPDSYKTLNNTRRILSHRSPKNKKFYEKTVKNDDSRSFFGPPNKNSKSSQKNKSASKKQTPLKNIKPSSKNDITQIVNIKTNRPLRTCRLNESQNDTCEKLNSNRILQITLTPIKIINKNNQNNFKNVKRVKVKNTNVSFSRVSEKNNPIVQNDADESPANSKMREQSNETKIRISDVSFSLPSKKITLEKKNTARNKNNSINKSVETNFSMVLRSNSISPAHKRVVAKKEVKSKAKPSTKVNKSKMY